MTISILLPVFNTSPYLEDCLRSITAQTEADWELLAVDDFSTDGSHDILAEYAAQDARIRVFKNNKKGIAPALQLAFEQSAGTLITRMDSDDLMLPHKLTKLKQDVLSKGIGHISTGQVAYFSETGLGEGYRKYADWLNGLIARGDNFSEVFKECPVPSPCWMAFKEDLAVCGAFQEEVYPEDYDLVFRWRQAGLKIIPCTEVLHQWRDHPARTSRTDDRYLDNAYLQLKMTWFLRSDHDTGRPLVLWGAGKKGKRIARMLNEKGIPFGWVTNNAAKTGMAIQGVELRHFGILEKLKNPQVIVAVAAQDDQTAIRDSIRDFGLNPIEHCYFFC